ncbi:MAG: IclR family transcriptional regulator [Chloroflexi bacterium]|nr:IclR family transcriptional regulator [Chloroflexota bacterium]
MAVPVREQGRVGIQSVVRAARILGLFTVANPRLTLAEVTQMASMSKATAHRYAAALRAVNLLRYDPSTGYSLGPQVLRLGAAARAGLPIVNIAGLFMRHLVEQVNETAVLSVWDGEAPVVVRTEDNVDRAVRVSIATGVRLSTASAQWRVFAAYLPESQVPGIRGKLRTSDLKRRLQDVRDCGVAVHPNADFGVVTIAAPVFGSGRILASLALIGTAATIASDPRSPMARRLRDVAADISSELGAFGLSGDDDQREHGKARARPRARRKEAATRAD